MNGIGIAAVKTSQTKINREQIALLSQFLSHNIAQRKVFYTESKKSTGDMHWTSLQEISLLGFSN
jgi:hypothetical protein